MSIVLVMPSSHLILCCPLLFLSPIPPSIRVFSNESTLHMRWSKYWSFSLSINPSNEYPGLISFRVDWLDLLAVQGTLKSLLQHHSSKASILQPVSIVVSIPACHAGDRGSIPRRGGERLLFCPPTAKIKTKQLSEKAMAPHSSTLAWKIPWIEEPGRLQSMRSRRVGHD